MWSSSNDDLHEHTSFSVAQQVTVLPNTVRLQSFPALGLFA